MRGLGVDVVSVERIATALERHGDRFRDRCFRPGEIALARRRGAAGAQALAGRWAAKEAFVKAVGAGAGVFGYRDVEVVSTGEGAPELKLHGAAAEALAAVGGERTMLSLSHERTTAVAVVVIL